MESRLISIVVPIYNEVDSLQTLLGEIESVAGGGALKAEVIFVDDGSTDASWERIRELAAADPMVGGIRFRRNRGKAAALMAGFKAARGDLVCMMDADLQDPPEEIPNLIARIDEGYDVVSGWKKVRHDPWHKVYPSRVFNKLIGWLTGVHLHDHVCGLKCFRREAVKSIRIYGEFHRFLGVLAAAQGFSVTEIPTLHRPRTTGVGKYGFTRFFKGFVDLLCVWTLTRYRWRPQHVIGVAGLVVILAELVLAMIGLVVTREPGSAFSGLVFWPTWVLSGVLGILVPGLILLGLGVVAVIMVDNRNGDGLYSIADRAGWLAERTDDTDQA